MQLDEILYLKKLKDLFMRFEKFLILTILFISPILSLADDINKNDLRDMDIDVLIEKAKSASSQDRVEIEKLIKKKIAKAHRNIGD